MPRALETLCLCLFCFQLLFIAVTVLMWFYWPRDVMLPALAVCFTSGMFLGMILTVQRLGRQDAPTPKESV